VAKYAARRHADASALGEMGWTLEIGLAALLDRNTNTYLLTVLPSSFHQPRHSTCSTPQATPSCTRISALLERLICYARRSRRHATCPSDMHHAVTYITYIPRKHKSVCKYAAPSVPTNAGPVYSFVMPVQLGRCKYARYTYIYSCAMRASKKNEPISQEIGNAEILVSAHRPACRAARMHVVESARLGA